MKLIRSMVAFSVEIVAVYGNCKMYALKFQWTIHNIFQHPVALNTNQHKIHTTKKAAYPMEHRAAAIQKTGRTDIL
jgi:hypothetical protein